MFGFNSDTSRIEEMPRTPTQKRSKATVEAIVDAGFAALAEVGAADVTTRQIAEKAGVGVGSFYEYFENKEQLFGAMTERVVNELCVRFRTAAPALVRLPLAEIIRELVRILYELLEANDGRYRIAARQVFQLGIQERLRPLERVLFDISVQILAHHPDLVRIRNLRAISYVVVHGAVAAVAHHLSDPHPPITSAELAEALVLLVTHYVEGELKVAAGPARKRRG